MSWSISPDNGNQRMMYKRKNLDDVKRKLLFEEEEEDCDTSTISLTDNAVGLYKYKEEYKQNHHGFSNSFEHSFNESQELIDLARTPRKSLYDCDEYSKDVYQYLREAEVNLMSCELQNGLIRVLTAGFSFKKHFAYTTSIPCPRILFPGDFHHTLWKIRYQPDLRSMRKQKDIDLAMRSVLVDWLVGVAEEFQLENETLYLAVSLIDRFLSAMIVPKRVFQLVGTTSIFIAAKYEEIYPPEAEDFVNMTGGACNKDQVLRMEPLILKALTFDVNVPTTYTFLQYISCAADLPKTVVSLAQYLCELTLLEAERFQQFLPSQIAAAAVSLSNYTAGYEVWDADLELVTGYMLEDLRDVTRCLYVAYCNSSRNIYRAIKEKYSTAMYDGVSYIPPPRSCF